MTRISRISTPRATLGAIALLVIVMAGFGLFADGGEPAAVGAQVANEVVEQPATETSQHCWTPTLIPVVAIDQRLEGNRDVRI